MNRCLLILALFCCTAFAAPNRPDITFLQMQSWMRSLGPAQWKRELKAMKQSGLNAIIWQYNRFDGEDYRASLDQVVKAAKQNGLKIYFGLDFDTDWWNKWRSAGYLTPLLKKEQERARAIWNRYHASGVFAGWYLPQEVGDWTTTSAQLEQLHVFFKKLSATCRRLSGRRYPVLASLYFEGKRKPNELAPHLIWIWQDTGIAALLIQDGVGEHGWGNALDTRVRPYFRALTQAADRVHIAVWPTVECFERRAGSRETASTKRIENQLRLFDGSYVHLVYFDFFHYLSPYRATRTKQNTAHLPVRTKEKLVR